MPYNPRFGARKPTVRLSPVRPRAMLFVMLIDSHHHMLPPAWIEALGADRVLANSRRSLRSPLEWSVAQSLAVMDRHGVDAAVLSLSDPGVGPGDAGLARRCNDFAAAAAARHPTRIGWLATLPMPDVDAALGELRHALDVLDADGVCLLSNYDDSWLGAPRFAPLFDELSRRGAVVFVHPTKAPWNPDLGVFVPVTAIEFPHNTTRAIASLLFGGTFALCPDIRFVFPHGGGTVPYIVRRLCSFADDPDLGGTVPGGAMEVLSRLWFDVVGASPFQIDALMRLVGPDRILFGTDFPYQPTGVGQTVSGVAAFGLGDQAVRGIMGGNAALLFPRLAR